MKTRYESASHKITANIDCTRVKVFIKVMKSSEQVETRC